MNANHGGGYSYRLCKIPEEGRSGLTEECFQRTPLFFASNEQWVQTGYDTETRIYFTANRTTKGTYPPGKKIKYYYSLCSLYTVCPTEFGPHSNGYRVT